MCAQFQYSTTTSTENWKTRETGLYWRKISTNAKKKTTCKRMEYFKRKSLNLLTWRGLLLTKSTNYTKKFWISKTKLLKLIVRECGKSRKLNRWNAQELSTNKALKSLHSSLQQIDQWGRRKIKFRMAENHLPFKLLCRLIFIFLAIKIHKMRNKVRGCQRIWPRQKLASHLCHLLMLLWTTETTPTAFIRATSDRVWRQTATRWCLCKETKMMLTKRTKQLSKLMKSLWSTQ